MNAQRTLLADIGGTNARFAWQNGLGSEIENVRTLPCSRYPSLADALRHYLAIVDRPVPAHCAIAIANPVVGDQVAMTNHQWTFSIAALKEELGVERLLVINDFTALALALPVLPGAQLRQLGGGPRDAHGAKALIGPGTGLGVSGLLPDGLGGWIPLQGEGGHVTLPACTLREQAVLDQIAQRYGHVSAERAVSGQGLENIHRALWLIDRPAQTPPALSAADISKAALNGNDAICHEALSLFCAFLGTVAGNLALTLGARNGVYIGGGIVPRLAAWIDKSPFRSRFESKGRFAAYLAPIPVFVIQADPSPALIGASLALNLHTSV